MLDFLIREWGNVSTVASSWVSWDKEARHDYLNEWPITEFYGEVLRDVITRTRLTSNQEVQYQRLLSVTDAARPMIEEILEQG